MVINPYQLTKYQEKATDNIMRKEISSDQSSLFSNLDFYKANQDSLVGKKGLEIYKKMKQDDQIKACLTIKKFARMSTKWSIKPGDSDNDQSVEMSEFIEYTFNKLKGTFEKHLIEILSALEYGFSITEKVYKIYDSGPHKGKIGLAKLGNREPFGYHFKTDDHNNIIGLCCDQAGLSEGSEKLGSIENPYPPDKFVIYSYNSEHGDPYGTSDLRCAYKAWWSKDLNIKWWNIFNERFGMPTTVAKYPAQGKGLSGQAIAEIDSILKNIQAKSGIRIPDNIELELLEATRQGKTTYGDAIDKFDLMISRSILVPSLLGFNNREQTGSYALGKSHFDVFLFVLEMLGRDIEETIVGEQIIKPLIQLNYGDIDEELMPTFEFESLVDEDTEARAKVAKMLVEGGLLDKREDWVRDYLSIPERDLEKYPFQTPIGEPLDPMISPSAEDEEDTPSEGSPTPKKTIVPKKEIEDDNKKKIPEDKLKELDTNKEKMQLNRQPNKFEKNTDFAQISDNMTLLSIGLAEALTPIIEKWKKDIVKKADKILREKAINEVNKLQIRGVGDFKVVLRDYMIKGHLDSKLQGLEEIQRGGFEVTIKKKFGLLNLGNFALEPWDPIPPKEAMNYFNNKVVATVVVDGKKKTIPLAKTAELNYYDKRAFTITGIESEYILNQSKLIIEKGLKTGMIKDTVNSLETMFDKYLVTGALKDGKLVSPARLKTMVRTNINEAVNEGRMAMYKDPDVDKAVPYLEWSSVMDIRTSPYCDELDGLIFKKNEVSPPPAHFNCRSTIIPLTTTTVESMGGVEVADWKKEDSKVGRQQGFRIDPLVVVAGTPKMTIIYE